MITAHDEYVGRGRRLMINSLRLYTATSILAITLSYSTISNVSASERTAIAEIDALKVVYIGRLSINFPKDSKISQVTKYQGAKFQKISNSKIFSDIQYEMKMRASSLSEEVMKTAVSPLGKRLERENPKRRSSDRLIGYEDMPDSILVLGFHKKNFSPDIVVELHKYLDGKHFLFLEEGTGADKYARIRNELLETSSRFIPLRTDQYPGRPGFCVDDGIFVDRGRPPANETFTLVVEFPQHPDTRFSIESIAIDRPDNEESLEQRARADLVTMQSQVGPVEVIERGTRKAADQPGYEIAIAANNDSGKRMKFFWGAEGLPNDVTRPFLEVNMTVEPLDGRPASFKSTAEAKALWDLLLGSLQILPGAT